MWTDSIHLRQEPAEIVDCATNHKRWCDGEVPCGLWPFESTIRAAFGLADLDSCTEYGIFAH